MVRTACIVTVLLATGNVGWAGADLAEPAVAERKPQFVPLTADEVARLVGQLGSPKYAERVAATRRLANGGTEVVMPLREAAQTDGETAVRAVRILEALYTRGPEPSSDAAQTALEDLAQTEGHAVAQQADTVLAMNYRLREKRAVVVLERLGAIVRYAVPGEQGFVPGRPQLPGDVPPQHVIVPLNWQGGAEGVRQLKRLDRLTILYPVRKELPDGDFKPSLTAEQVADIQAALPQLRVEWRGPACLGISGTDLLDAGCQLRTVDPNLSAGRAGLRVDDILTDFDGQPITGFQDLVRLIGRHEPGDKVPCTVRRGNQELEFKVELDGWK